MPFQKGYSGNLNGKPKGVLNKTTRELRDIIQSILEKNLKTIETDLQELAPESRIKLLLQMSEFILPKCGRLEISGVDEEPLKPTLSDEQFEILVAKINRGRVPATNSTPIH